MRNTHSIVEQGACFIPVAVTVDPEVPISTIIVRGKMGLRPRLCVYECAPCVFTHRARRRFRMSFIVCPCCTCLIPLSQHLTDTGARLAAPVCLSQHWGTGGHSHVFSDHIFMRAEQMLLPTEPFPSSEQRFGRVCATAPENCSLALHGMSCTWAQKRMCCQGNRAGVGLVSGVMVVKKLCVILATITVSS